MRTKIKRCLLLFLVGITLLSMIACTKTNEQSDANKPTQNGETATKQKEENVEDKILTITSSRDVGRGNEDAYWTNLNLYVWEPLIGQANDGELVPVLATDWSTDDNGLTWKFKLIEGVKFSDGTDFNADVAMLNFERMEKISPTSSTFFTLDINKSYPGYKEFRKTGDYEIEIKFENPMPMLPYRMLNWGSPMISPECFDKETGMFTKPVIGTGQFIISEHVKDQYTDFVRNENYWGEKAKIDKFRVRMIPDHDTRVAALRSGEVQGLYDNGAIQPLAAKELEATGNFNISSAISANIQFIGLNQKVKPLDDVRLRQAISMAVDRDVLLNDIYGGYGKVTSNVVTPLNYYYVDTPIVKDVEKAKKLAKEVLGDNRLSLTMICRSQYQTDCQLIAAYLKEIGLDINIQALESSAYQEKRKSGDYEICYGFRGADNSDPSTMLYSFMASDGKDNTMYNVNFHDEEVDKMLQEMKNTYDQDKLIEIIKELQVISSEKLPIIPLFGVDTTVASSKSIQGFDAMWTGVTIFNTEWSK